MPCQGWPDWIFFRLDSLEGLGYSRSFTRRHLSRSYTSSVCGWCSHGFVAQGGYSQQERRIVWVSQERERGARGLRRRRQAPAPRAPPHPLCLGHLSPLDGRSALLAVEQLLAAVGCLLRPGGFLVSEAEGRQRRPVCRAGGAAPSALRVIRRGLGLLLHAVKPSVFRQLEEWEAWWGENASGRALSCRVLWAKRSSVGPSSVRAPRGGLHHSHLPLPLPPSHAAGQQRCNSPWPLCCRDQASARTATGLPRAKARMLAVGFKAWLVLQPHWGALGVLHVETFGWSWAG